MNPFAKCLVENLKSLNAKEREYLVRYAYQGDEQARSPLSEAMVRDLTALLPELGKAKCVFAGMDYHLDWLHASLYLACRSLSVDEAFRKERVESLGGDLQGELDKSLRPVTGGQEDVDLLTVFADGETTFLLFIEAKGVGSFGRVQLARKLVRLDRILALSGARDHEHLRCELLLTGPDRESEWRRFPNWLTYANTLPDEHRELREQLKEHSQHIGLGNRFLALTGFPEALKKVTRTKSPPGSKDFTHWKITSR